MGSPTLRAKLARGSLGAEGRDEAGRTPVRNPREESGFHQVHGKSRQGCLVMPWVPSDSAGAFSSEALACGPPTFQSVHRQARTGAGDRLHWLPNRKAFAIPLPSSSSWKDRRQLRCQSRGGQAAHNLAAKSLTGQYLYLHPEW